MLRKKKQTSNSRQLPDAQRSAPVFSYYSSRNLGDQSRQSLDKRVEKAPENQWLTTLPSIIAAFLIVASCVYATSLRTPPTIQMHASENAQLMIRDQNIYEESITEIMSSSIFNRNKLTINTSQVAKEIEASFPELGDVSVILPLISRRPVIDAHPSLSALKLVTNNDSFIINEQGRAILRTDDAPSSLRDQLPNVIDESGLEIKVGQTVLPTEIISFVRTISAQLNASKIMIKDMTLPRVANELHLRLVDETYYVKFDLQADGRQQTGALLAVREQMKEAAITPDEYIDVRVPDKVFYK